MLYRVNFEVVTDARRLPVTNDLVYLETAGPLAGEALRNVAVAAVAREYDLGIVDLDSVTIEAAVLEKATNW
jgi:hypothetical protein